MNTRGVLVGSVALAAGLAVGSSAMAQAIDARTLTPALKDRLASLYPNGGVQFAGPQNFPGDGIVGPDVIVGALMNSFGSDQNETINPVATNGNIRAYGVGTTSCNIGDTNLLWDDGSARKPVIAQNFYRVKNGRIEQIGQGWLKHAFVALTQSLCGSCNGNGGWVLGVGCSDPYTASRNAGSGNPASLGPRYEVNPFTGRHFWPFQTNPTVQNSTFRRVQVDIADMADFADPNVRYLMEGIYMTGDDAAFGNGWNNASYRQVRVNSNFTWSLSNASAEFRTQRTKPAIFAWQDIGGPNGTPDPSVLITKVSAGASFNPGAWQVINNVPVGGNFYLPNPPTGDGDLYIGSKAIDLGNGTWRYEYAVYNLTSDRGAGSFSVPVPGGATITNVTVRQSLAHSGDPAADATRNAAWTSTVSGGTVTWATTNSWDPGQPFNGSYIRWGTLYNFSFVADRPPVNTENASIRFYKPGTPDTVEGRAWTPQPGGPCYANCDGSTGNPALTPADFVCFLNRYRAGDAYANCDGSTGTPALTPADFVCFLTAYRNGC